MAEKCAQAGCGNWALSGSRYCATHRPPGSQRRPAVESNIDGVRAPEVATDSHERTAA
ncbi:hypothetical protein Aspvir_001728 [Aspergillus viridinutans]|uniref:Uncharacterized protein n=1 Tax=Aspergillus viridinutans TaxID=75553 RepID=A0A9P3BNT9_ASPVI|nr:uncharacterized protein Aspvir_001728 [Aspergillus viridinutans]GIJ99594.1 hypothetical protein Aspvir_001728 [Aspergillus viridinutans]